LIEKASAPKDETKKAKIITFFSPIYSTKNPEGIDITPYAKKNEKGRKAAIDKLKLNALIMSGKRGPMIFVKNEITKKTNKIIPSKKLLFK
tara:strand:+ start:490 stop:762 length:273 start_codon:yes stop_codon:yes gene_type:complete